MLFPFDQDEKKPNSAVERSSSQTWETTETHPHNEALMSTNGNVKSNEQLKQPGTPELKNEQNIKSSLGQGHFVEILPHVNTRIVIVHCSAAKVFDRSSEERKHSSTHDNDP